MSAGNEHGQQEETYTGEQPRLAREDQEKLIQRLYYNHMEQEKNKEAAREAELKRTTEKGTKRIPKEEEQKLVERIYDQQRQRFELNKTEREKKAAEEAHKNDKTLSKEEIEEHVKRMYDEELAKSKQRREQLEKQYCPTQEEKKVSKAKLQETVERLHHVDYEKRDEELFQKYVYPHDPKMAKINKSEEEAMASRLCTTKGPASSS